MAFYIRVKRDKLYHGKKAKNWVGPFTKRQQARQWCRNHWYSEDHVGMDIIHPNGDVESFTWLGESGFHVEGI